MSAAPLFTLASSSPRRLHILKELKIPFVVCEHSFDEAAVPWDGRMEEHAQRVAIGKALSVTPSMADQIIVAADTLVFLDQRPYGKASSRAEAEATLMALQGRRHTVYSAVAVRQGERCECLGCATEVRFNALSLEQIRAYLNSIHWGDKAGSYAMQEKSALLVAELRGCYYNVVGLPVNTLECLLNSFGVSLWTSFTAQHS